FFFFQAEDGIRDRNVTGVQTCALPICSVNPLVLRHIFKTILCTIEIRFTIGCMCMFMTKWSTPMGWLPVWFMKLWSRKTWTKFEIGRASCRERVEIWVGAE